MDHPLLVDEVRQNLAARATVAAYREHGVIPAAAFDQAALELRWLAGDLLRRGYSVVADATSAFADRCDETAELARLLRRRQVAA
jgi:predicted kinase